MKNKYQEYQEAVKELKYFVHSELDGTRMLDEYLKYCDTLQELVDKEKPKKPVYSGRPADTQQYCPVCHSRVANIKYCWSCGQKLDWSDENEQ